jgi:hypothetical protein
MSIPKNYLHDRVVLLLLSVNSFLTLLGTILIFWRMSSGRSSSYIIEYRANLGISAYKAGKISDILAFVVFLFFILAMNTILSIRIYGHHRNYALTILGLGTRLGLLAIIVSNALLVLR